MSVKVNVCMCMCFLCRKFVVLGLLLAVLSRFVRWNRLSEQLVSVSISSWPDCLCECCDVVLDWMFMFD